MLLPPRFRLRNTLLESFNRHWRASRRKNCLPSILLNMPETGMDRLGNTSSGSRMDESDRIPLWQAGRGERNCLRLQRRRLRRIIRHLSKGKTAHSSCTAIPSGFADSRQDSWEGTWPPLRFELAADWRYSLSTSKQPPIQFQGRKPLNANGWRLSSRGNFSLAGYSPVERALRRRPPLRTRRDGAREGRSTKSLFLFSGENFAHRLTSSAVR